MHVAKKYLFIFAQMVRIRTTVLMYLFALIGSSSVVRDVVVFPKFFLVCGAVTCWYAFSTCLNDYGDAEIDKINLVKQQGERPLLNGAGNRMDLLFVGGFSMVLALVLSYLISYGSLIVTVLALVYGAIYSLRPIRISYRGAWSYLTLPLAYVVYPFILGLQAKSGGSMAVGWLLLIGLCVCFIGRIALKDLRDVRGDKKFNKRTFTVRYGVPATAYFAASAWLVGGIILAAFTIKYTAVALVIFVAISVISNKLFRLAKEKNLTNQLIHVASIGRIGNLIIFALLIYLSKQRGTTSLIILAGLVVTHILMVWETDLYLTKNND